MQAYSIKNQKQAADSSHNQTSGCHMQFAFFAFASIATMLINMLLSCFPAYT